MELTRDVTLPAGPDAVWELLTRPEDLEGWLGAEVHLDPTPGAGGRVTDHDGTVHHLVVEEVEPGRRLSWRWWTDDEGELGGSRVEVTVTPAGSGALVTVIERPIPTGPSPSLLANAHAAAAASAEAWSSRLLHLEALLLLAAVRR
jgi:uncharacterized protein YndB with AHSA1/START domain